MFCHHGWLVIFFVVGSSCFIGGGRDVRKGELKMMKYWNRLFQGAPTVTYKGEVRLLVVVEPVVDTCLMTPSPTSTPCTPVASAFWELYYFSSDIPQLLLLGVFNGLGNRCPPGSWECREQPLIWKLLRVELQLAMAILRPPKSWLPIRGMQCWMSGSMLAC